MNCKLCLQNKKLIKAHIIPDFMHNHLYDEQHKLYKLKYGAEPEKAKKISTGEYDTNILCADCDNKISNYESYFSKVIYGGQFLNSAELPLFRKYKDNEGLIFTEIKNMNYLKSRLFLLSLLWRASITERPNFSDIKLSKKEEDNIREMIFYENPGEPFEFGCTLITFMDHKNIESGIIASPRRDIDGKQFIFLINGFFYIFYSNFDINEKIKPHILDKSGKMDILHIPEFKAKELLNNFLGIQIF